MLDHCEVSVDVFAKRLGWTAAECPDNDYQESFSADQPPRPTGLRCGAITDNLLFNLLGSLSASYHFN